MHACGLPVVDLHAIHPHVTLAGLGVARHDARESDEASRVLWPALQDWKVEKREAIALDYFFAGAGRDCARKKLSCFRQEGEHLQFVEESLWRLEVHEDAHALSEFVEGSDAERQLHARVRAKLINEKLRSWIALEVLEQERGTSGPLRCARLDGRGARPHMVYGFADAVGDFGDFQDRIDFGVDAFEFAGTVERG